VSGALKIEPSPFSIAVCAHPKIDLPEVEIFPSRKAKEVNIKKIAW
jgi:hypothetical protein